jgi:hypothetical protein
MAKELTVKRSPKNADVHAQVGDKKLAFDTTGTAKTQVEPGTHVLIYFLVAEPGTEFKMEIQAPPEAVWSREHRIPSDGVTVGTKKFPVNG